MEGSRRFVSDARDVLARATVSTFPTAVPRLNEPELLPGKIRVSSLSSTDTRSRVGFGDPARSKIASSAKPRLTVCEPKNWPCSFFRPIHPVLLYFTSQRFEGALAVCATYF